MPLAIRELTTEDGVALYDLLLRAIREHPEAFGADYETQRTISTEAFVENVLAQMTGDWFLLGAFDADVLVGMLEVRRNVRAKFRHIVTFGTMYVAPEVRGHGTGRALMDAAIARVRRMDGVEKINLCVTTTSTAARRLYLSLGFVPYGVEPRGLKTGGRNYDLEFMALILHH